MIGLCELGPRLQGSSFKQKSEAASKRCMATLLNLKNACRVDQVHVIWSEPPAAVLAHTPRPPVSRTLRQRLARTVLHFQDTFVQTQSPASGSLCQVWLPEATPQGSVVLKSKGLPFCVAGVGDFLALFRCISCRYCFGTDVQKPDLLGAPGRVYTTLTPEMSQNVQQYSRSVYLRASEAQQCKVQSTLVVPLFDGEERAQPCGVLEVVQAVQDMRFDTVMETLAHVLQLYGLSTSDQSISSGEMQERSEEIKTLAAGSPTRQEADSAPEPPPPKSSENLQPVFSPGAQEAAPSQPVPSPPTPGPLRLQPSNNAGRRGGSRGKGSGNPGKPGKRLQLQDLQLQFGVGLREAAKRLGICPTTLKRACRRHGIQRWPRRQLVKLSKAIDQIQATGSAGRQMAIPSAEQMSGDMGSGSLMPAPDMRWTTLAKLVPAITASMPQRGMVEDSTPSLGLLPLNLSSASLKHEYSASQNDSSHQGETGSLDRTPSVSNLPLPGTTTVLASSAIPILTGHQSSSPPPALSSGFATAPAAYQAPLQPSSSFMALFPSPSPQTYHGSQSNLAQVQAADSALADHFLRGSLESNQGPQASLTPAAAAVAAEAAAAAASAAIPLAVR
ncbi:hypothetical protein WJX84_002759 [Apatococcus fuscideae]|uniref:RWP-RK domain-containing protein n=1 Tax=Apatococcus fuscideae TaxID=2026836 RepID=A0AAW1S8M4_9CHLO